MSQERITAVEVGENTTIGVAGDPCEAKHGGYWFCATHDEGFLNQFEKDTHISDGEHRLVWACFEHGPEKP